MTIFDMVVASDVVGYWETMPKQRGPYFGESKFPAVKDPSIKLEYIKGSHGLPIVLAPSAFDVKAKKRKRIGFDKLTYEMPFFKESIGIDEVLRQQLNIVLQTGNQDYIDAVMNHVFREPVSLIEGAAAQRERMRMQLLTTGCISITANGEDLDYDFQMPSANKVDTTVPWSNPDAKIVDDIRNWQNMIEDATGVRPLEALCSRKTYNYMAMNNQIKAAIWFNVSGTAMPALSDAQVNQYLMQQLGITVTINTQRYTDEAGNKLPYVPDDVFVGMPAGDLGNTHFGPTPEESDLMAGTVDNVAITDTGVAVTTMKNDDPVTVDTKVTMVCMPSFEQADQCFIADVAHTGA